MAPLPQLTQEMLEPACLRRYPAPVYRFACMPQPEKAVIERIKRASRTRTLFGRRYPSLITGIGDDCAVLRVPSGHEALVTTDFSIEGVHFRREWHPPDSVGHRCLARGLSDIAAMGGDPLAAFLSLAVPAATTDSWIEGFFTGLLRLAKWAGIPLAGGDLAESPTTVVADVSVLGSVPKGKAILRSGAKPGDRIYVTGTLGGAAQVISNLYANPARKPNVEDFPETFYPRPQLAVGKYLREHKLASALIDISDGLSTDLGHICDESSVGAEIVEAAVPRAFTGPEGEQVELRHALHGGDDYQLLFTAPEKKRIPEDIEGVRITEIGWITRSKRVLISDIDGRTRAFKPEGWQHFGS